MYLDNFYKFIYSFSGDFFLVSFFYRIYQFQTVSLALLFTKIIVEGDKFELFTPPHLGMATFRLKNVGYERLCWKKYRAYLHAYYQIGR